MQGKSDTGSDWCEVRFTSHLTISSLLDILQGCLLLLQIVHRHQEALLVFIMTETQIFEIVSILCHIFRLKCWWCWNHFKSDDGHNNSKRQFMIEVSFDIDMDGSKTS